jgi:hypothetical protein
MQKHYIDFYISIWEKSSTIIFIFLFLEISQWNDIHFSNYIIKIKPFF